MCLFLRFLVLHLVPFFLRTFAVSNLAFPGPPPLPRLLLRLLFHHLGATVHFVLCQARFKECVKLAAIVFVYNNGPLLKCGRSHLFNSFNHAN